jgi:hypothetical protein
VARGLYHHDSFFKVPRKQTGFVAFIYISVLIRLIFLGLLSSPALALDCLHTGICL